MVFFTFPEDGQWNPDREVVEFSVILDPYEVTVRVPRRVSQGLLDQSPTPERCMEAFHLQRLDSSLSSNENSDAGSYQMMAMSTSPGATFARGIRRRGAGRLS